MKNLNTAMKNLICSMAFLLIGITHAQAQIGCQGFTPDFSILACLTNISNCQGGVAPCDDATYDMIFGSQDWGFFFCSNIPAGGGTCNSLISYSPLPVELTVFGAEIRENGVHLNWATASEINNDGFFIETSMDGEHWGQLDFVKGNGTTKSESEYSYLWQAPHLGANYIRLKQIDFDGQYAYSNIQVALWRGGTENLELVIVPNPVVDQLVPVLPFEYNDSETIDYSIHDELGRVVKSFPSTSKYNVKLSVHELAPGNYTIISSSDGYMFSAKFVKL